MLRRSISSQAGALHDKDEIIKFMTARLDLMQQQLLDSKAAKKEGGWCTHECGGEGC